MPDGSGDLCVYNATSKTQEECQHPHFLVMNIMLTCVCVCVAMNMCLCVCNDENVCVMCASVMCVYVVAYLC